MQDLTDNLFPVRIQVIFFLWFVCFSDWKEGNFKKSSAAPQ
ncbi:hypothetical protein I33_2658 [Bacillus subtilis subsp. subtilis str. RO-NN-1]|nr:hypothetical protein I33_2658 [Bacillus subtilis subsp. subtilis str. RO-NN-1]